MANNDATVIVGKLSDEELQKSIDKLVSNIATANDLIRKDFDHTINHIQKSFKSLGDIKVGAGGASDGGSSRRSSVLKQEEQTVKNLTSSYDNFAKAQQVAVRTPNNNYRNADTLETMKIQLELLRQRLIETRQQYSSFVALAANATRTGDEGLYKFATSNVHAFEAEAKSLIQQIRGVQNAVQQMGDVIAPQGHTIQNMVNSIGKANPELAQLKEKLTSGKTELSQFALAESDVAAKAGKSAEEIKKQAQAIRESEEWKKKGSYFLMLDKETNTFATIEAKDRRSIEEQLLAIYEMEARTKKDTVLTEQQQNTQIKEELSTEERLTQLEKERLGIAEKITTESQKRTQPKTFASYDTLREAMAHVLGLQQAQVKLADTETASYDRLNTTLKQLRQTYDRLSVSERNSEQGKVLIASMHEVEDAIRKARQQASRPVNLREALGLSEKTLDDITYKMQQLASYRSGLDVNTMRAEIRDVNAEYNKLKKKYDEVMQKNQQMVASNNALGRSWNYMKNRLAFYFTVGASTQFIKNLIEVRSQYEMNERALGILINSAERGTQIFNELSQMALVSPYTLIELSSAAKQLTAYDIAAKDVVDTTRRLADMASAVGVPMERLTYALGQIKAYGYLNSRDARMFANAGIPLVKELSKYYSELEGKVVSVGDVYDRMKKKAIDFNSVMAVVTKMTDEGGKFFDFQAKMAGTLKVQLANLTLAWNNMLNEIGSSEQSVLTGGIAGLKTLFLHWTDIQDVLTKIVYALGLYKTGQFVVLGMTGRLTTAMGMQELVGKKLQARLASLTAANKAFVSAATMGWVALAAAVVEVLYTWDKNTTEIEHLNETIAKGAKESAQAINDFIKSAEMSYARLSAETGKLPKSDAEKTWEAVREQLELSAMSAKDIIPELIKVENINERLTIAFNLAERIKEANEKLADLYDNLEMSQDTILGGLFGEGLVEDIEDYNEHLKISAETAEYWSKKHTGFWSNSIEGIKVLYNQVKEDLGDSLGEAQSEISKFARDAAQTIKDELGEEGLKDSIKVNEAIARIVNGIEQQFPQIKGKGKALFESIFNDIMAQEFNGAVDKQLHYYRIFLERLKKDHGSAFQQVTDDILKDTHVWSDGQIDAIQKTAERIKEDIPEAYQNSITEILNDLNSREFKLRIVAEFATTSLDEVGKAFKRRFIEANTDVADATVQETKDGLKSLKGLSPWGDDKDADKRRKISQEEAANMQKYGTFMQKSNESDLDYQERIKKEKQKQLDIKKAEEDIITKNKDKETEGAKAVVAAANDRLKAANAWLKAADEVEDWGGYDFTTKKENAAANKAQHQAESELQKALKNELSLIDEVRDAYKRLTSAGVNHIDAINTSTQGFDETVDEINKSLTKFGLKKLDLSKFAGITNPQELVQLLQEQLNTLMNSPYVKAAEIKDLQVKIQKLGIDVAEFNQKTFADSLNNSLSRLKDEYELAIALDADPELGNMFADMMGVNADDLPHTVQEYANEYTKYLNKYLAENGSKVELPHLNLTDDDLKMFEEMVKENKLNANLYEKIAAAVKDVREKTNKDISETIKSWDKLIEKYGEYEARINAIRNNAAKERVELINKAGTEQQKSTAVRLLTKLQATDDPQEKQNLEDDIKALVTEIAQKDGSILKLSVAIDNEQLRQSATEAYKEFRESPIWSIANGNLAGMTHNALGGLITSIEKFKKTTKGLDGKQLKEIDKVVRSLRKQQREGNPFLAIGNAIDEAKARAEEIQPELKNIMKQIVAIEDKRADGNALSEEEEKELKSLKQQWKDLWKTGNVSSTEIVGYINSCISTASQAVSMFNEMATALSGGKWNEAQEVLGDVASTIEKAGQGAAIGAQISNNGYGAIIGAVAGGLMGAITAFADNANKKINKQIEDSETAVKRLEVAYVDLQHTMEEAYGSGIVASKRLMASMKQLELAELERQLALERSRSQKDKDEGKISDLQKQIKELRYEIEDTITEITDELLGSDAGGFAEGLVDAMIAAFKNGEDYMKVFEEKFDEMIDNMIMKSITSKVVAQYIDSLWDSMDDRIKNRSQNEAANLAAATKRREQLENMDVYSYAYEEHGIGKYGLDMVEEAKRNMEKLYALDLATAKSAEEAAQKAYDSAMEMNDSDISYLISKLAEIKPELGEKLREILGEYYKFGETSNKELSALQQGISGITEDTAGALEAYMNGVSQQVYLQSDILSQIRDAVVGFNMDIQVASMSQILLQLRSSYEIQMSIHSLLEGWNNPAGNAVRVELV